MPGGLTISEAARKIGLSPHTLRFYRRIGLIRGVPRAANGSRRYGPDELVWLEFLKRLRATGMPLPDMKRFAELRQLGGSVAERRQLLETHSHRVSLQIGELQANLEAIRSKLARLAGGAASGDKP